MTTPAQLLANAKALIDTPEKWMRGKFTDGKCFCSIGALMQAAKIEQRKNVENPPLEPSVIYVASHVHLDKAVRSHPKNPNRKAVISFNDDPSISHEDVMKAFDDAIQIAERDQKADLEAHGFDEHGFPLPTQVSTKSSTPLEASGSHEPAQPAHQQEKLIS